MPRACAHVTVVQQLSLSDCLLGSSFGCYDVRSLIWVSRGCRARFRVAGTIVECGAAKRHSPPSNCSLPPTPRRAFITLAVKGRGHYIASSDSDRQTPNYLQTVLPLLCSFARTRSRYPLYVLGSNLTQEEQSLLTDHGADGFLSLDSSQQPLAALPSEPRARRTCISTRRGGWMISGRSDFRETLLKLSLWSLSGLFDEVAFVDADMLFLRRPDNVFDTLNTRQMASRKRHHRLDWRVHDECRDPKHGHPDPSLATPLCDQLELVASESGRFEGARFLPSALVWSDACEDRYRGCIIPYHSSNCTQLATASTPPAFIVPSSSTVGA